MPISIDQWFVAFVIFNATLLAQQTDSLSQKDVDSVVQQEESAFVAAYNSADANAVVVLYTETASVLTEAGVTQAGRSEIQKALNASFSTPGRKIKIENNPQNSIAVSKDVIVVQGTSRMSVSSGGSSQPPSDFLYTRVLVRRGEQWLIAAAEFARPNPWLVNLPPTLVGQTSAAEAVTLTNTGPKPLRLTKVVLGGRAADDFSQTNTCAVPIGPGASCFLKLAFQPKRSGTRTARIWFMDDANTGIHEIRLIGTGKQSSSEDGLIQP